MFMHQQALLSTYPPCAPGSEDVRSPFSQLFATTVWPGTRPYVLFSSTPSLPRCINIIPCSRTSEHRERNFNPADPEPNRSPGAGSRREWEYAPSLARRSFEGKHQCMPSAAGSYWTITQRTKAPRSAAVNEELPARAWPSPQTSPKRVDANPH